MLFTLRPAFAVFLLTMAALAPAQARGGADELMPAIACPSADRSIAAQGFVPIGGIDQWVTIRGARCGNPVLLFVHGGPGNPMSPYSAAVFGGWEADFTIVQWDQRGAGRTFARNPATAQAALSIDGIAADGTELAAYLAERLGQSRVVLIGTSWGSALAVHMAKARPDLFHAYVGISQLVGQRANLDSSYRNLLARAAAAGDSATVATIEALGPPPWRNPRHFGALRRAIRAYERHAVDPSPDNWWVPAPLYATAAAASAYEAGEDYSYLQFVGLTGDGLLARIDLPALGPRFEIPVFLVQGEEDLLTDAGVARRYFDFLTAPEKRFVLVPRAGHDPNPAMFDAVHRLLVERATGWR